ncbi:NACHT, LRR and PYD domains-containing protein 3-like isoform X2 [Rhineura floridana]|uniref:NACHT, LRR and PYD domains-containing protein 3-like isoform X2 n=1 Tax=Rhineura floridana TaxID=261503 RepID=UPI002AC84316|nr:NACHT, LRR and PYD domains-containing protein 3-like isoform X2 [Rhineura floridana]
MEDLGEPIEDALLFALDNLSEENFKRFKNKLCFLKMEGKANIPRSKLEKADTVDTVWLLFEAYGKEGACEVAITVFRAINLQDSATRLQKWKHNDCRKKYKRHIQETFWSIPELGCYPAGATVSLHQRYTELFLSRRCGPQERAHELVAVERKHRKMEAHPEEGLEVGMENLFDSDAQGKSSRTIVLLGPAGVGKTTAMWKIMLDWASGKFWQERFEYVFYISCKAMNYTSGPMSVGDLILNTCPPGTLLVEDILMNQDNVLFLVDGFDELKDCGLPNDILSSDPCKKQATTTLVMSLLRKRLLAKCHLIVATRPIALGPLLQCLRSPQFVEVLGFRPAQRKEYFYHFFEAKEEATQAFEFVRRNETLFDMCFLPILCWIICSTFRQEPQRDFLKDIPESATFTEIHMLFLCSFFGYHSKLCNLEGLCSLAKDGMLHKTMAFGEEELKEHGFGCSDLETLSASGRVLHQEDAYRAIIYRFVHLSFQEFFAALFYLLDADGNPAASSLKDLNEVLGNKKQHGSNYSMLMRFLFGLSSARRLNLLQKAWGCKMTGTRLCQEMLRWVEQEAKCQSFRRGEQLLELCHCIYETEDPQFAESILRHVCNLDLQDLLSTKLDFAALSFCLLAAPNLHSLRLSGHHLRPSTFSQLLPGLLKPLEIQLHHCSLTAAACERLSLVLASNQFLSELDLEENHLGDGGARKLCEGLQHPQSRLQRLMLHHCGLTAGACEDLASVLETSKSLMELGLGENNLGDEGIRQLCEVLRKPHCKLQRLAVTMRTLNRTTQKKLQAARAARPQLILTSYYPPGYAAFPGEG